MSIFLFKWRCNVKLEILEGWGGLNFKIIEWSLLLFKRNLKFNNEFCDWFFINLVIFFGVVVNDIM